MYAPHSFKEHSLMLCCFCLAVIFVCLAVSEGIEPSLNNRCRYLSVGRSILHQSGRPFTLHPNMGAACPFHSPFHSVWALPAMTQFSEWQHSFSVHYPLASTCIDVVPLPYIRVPPEVCNQNTLPVVFTHLQWMLQ